MSLGAWKDGRWVRWATAHFPRPPAFPPKAKEGGKRQHSDFLAHWSRHDDDNDNGVGVLVPEKVCGQTLSIEDPLLVGLVSAIVPPPVQPFAVNTKQYILATWENPFCVALFFVHVIKAGWLKSKRQRDAACVAHSPRSNDSTRGGGLTLM